MKNQKTFNLFVRKIPFIVLLFLIIPIGLLAQFKPKSKKDNNSTTKTYFKIDSLSGLYQYQEIFDIPNTTQAEIYYRVKSFHVKVKENVKYDKEPEKLTQITSFSYALVKAGAITEIFDIKDNKLRWTVTDILFAKYLAGALQGWFKIETKKDPLDLIDWLNKNLYIWRDDLIKTVVSPPAPDKNW